MTAAAGGSRPRARRCFAMLQPKLITFDDRVLDALKRYGRMPSYAIRNHLEMTFQGKFRTERVLAALKRLEKEGKVRRVKSGYATIIMWAP
jgi:hypothetical protein